MAQESQHNKDAKPTFLHKRDIIIIAAILIIAAGFFFFYQFIKVEGKTATVTIGLTTQEQTVEKYSLEENQIINFKSEGIEVHLEIKNQKIRFIHSECADHNCESFGWLQNEGDWAACLPAGVVVRIDAQ